MARRVLPVGLVVAAAAADGAGVHGFAFYLLLAAVPVGAFAALGAFGDLLDDVGSRLHALLWAIVLVLTVAGAAVRAPAVTEGTVPAVARSALVACLAIFCVQAVVSLASELRR
jgi:hypothetical protein